MTHPWMTDQNRLWNMQKECDRYGRNRVSADDEQDRMARLRREFDSFDRESRRHGPKTKSSTEANAPRTPYPR